MQFFIPRPEAKGLRIRTNLRLLQTLVHESLIEINCALEDFPQYLNYFS